MENPQKNPIFLPLNRYNDIVALMQRNGEKIHGSVAWVSKYDCSTFTGAEQDYVKENLLETGNNGFYVLRFTLPVDFSPIRVPQNEADPSFGTVEPLIGVVLRDYQWECLELMARYKFGVFSIPTGGGKTAVLAACIRLLAPAEKQVLVLCHRVDLQRQLATEIGNMTGESVGKFGDSRARIEVDTWQTVFGHYTEVSSDRYGMILVDECHRAAAASFHEIGCYFDTNIRMGVTATAPELSARSCFLMCAFLGPIYTIRKLKEMQRNGTLQSIGLCRYEIHSQTLFSQLYHRATDIERMKEIEHALSTFSLSRIEKFRLIDEGKRMISRCTASRRRRETRFSYIEERVLTYQNRARLNMIADILRGYVAQGRQILVSVELVEYGKRLVESLSIPALMLNGKGIYVNQRFRIHYGNVNLTRKWVFDSMRKGERFVLISTLVREGIDIPTLDLLCFCGAEKSFISTMQTVGRILRKKKTEQPALVVNIMDMDTVFLCEHALYREQILMEMFDSVETSIIPVYL